MTYGAPNLFKQFSKPFAEPHISELASGNFAIYPGFLLGCAIVACSPTCPQRRPFHSAASQSIDDRLFQKACLSLVPVESSSISIGHPPPPRIGCSTRNHRGFPQIKKRLGALLRLRQNQFLNKQRQATHVTRVFAELPGSVEDAFCG